MRRSDDRRLWWLWAGAVAAVALLSRRPAEPGDVWMYAATGRWVLDNHAIPRADTLSWTFAGRPWQSNGWGWGVIVDIAWRIGGFAAVTLLKPLFVVLVAGAIVFAARALGSRLVPAMIGSVAAIILIEPWITERPQLASFVLFPLGIGLAARAIQNDRLHVGWLIAVLVTFAVWANLHTVVLQGALVVVVFLAARSIGSALANRSLRPLVPGGVTAVGVIVASFCTPYGLAVLPYSSRVRELSKATITEWFPVWRGGPDAYLPGLALLVTVAVVVVLRAWRRPALLAPLAVCWLLTIDAVRNGPYLVIGMAVFLVPLVPTGVAPGLAGRRDLATVVVAVMAVFAVVVTVPAITQLGEPSPLAPVAATDALPAGCRLRNDYRVGGWLLFHRPDIPVSIDGRNDLYGASGYDQQVFFEDAASAPRAAEAFRNEGVDCVIAVPGDPIVAALTDAGWRRAADDGGGVLLLAPPR